MHNDLSRPLAIVGNLNVDQWVSTIERFPAWDEELIIDAARIELAGTAGYVAQAARALGIAPFIVSTIGDDIFGDFIRRELATHDIDDSGIETVRGKETSIGIIVIGAGGKRGILTVLGAHDSMDVSVAERHDTRLAGCAEVLLCGNYLLPRFSPAAVLGYARRLHARGQTVVFDPGWDPAGWPEHTREETFALLAEVSLFMPNEEELCHLTGAATWQAALDVMSDRVPEVVVKRGADGAVCAAGGEWIDVPGVPVKAANTIGAGDVFDAAFIYGRRKGWPPRESLEFACAVAAYVVSQAGSRHYPDEVAALEFLRAARSGCVGVSG